MIFIITAVFFLLCMLAATVNTDVFSPAKIFLLFFLMFHGGIYFSDISTLTKSLVLLVLLTGSALIFLEGLRGSNDEMVRRIREFRALGRQRGGLDFRLTFWLLSLPSVLAQIYMIREFGGIAGYFNSVALRVVEWSGFGWARVLISLIIPINVVYFAVGLTRRRSYNWWLSYLAHFALVLVIGSLSGSRSSLLGVFAFQLIAYHYIRGPVSWRLASSLAAGLAFSAMVLGVVRQGIRWDAGGLALGQAQAGERFSFATFYYGIDPLEMIATDIQLPLAHGSTFLSLFTNWIPRSLWPGKPDSGGVFFTKYYAGNQWDGYSNLTPTYLGEWVINFGWAAGLIGFAISMFAILALLNRLYRKFLADAITRSSQVAAVDVVIFIHVVWSSMALIPGEVTNVAMNFVLFQLVPLLGIRVLLSSMLRKAERSVGAGLPPRSTAPAMAASQSLHVPLPGPPERSSRY